MLHVRQGKGSEDRYIPLGIMLVRDITTYLSAEKPQQYLFEGQIPGEAISRNAERNGW